MAGSVSRSDEGATISSPRWYAQIDTFSFFEERVSTLFKEKVYPFCEKGLPFLKKGSTLFKEKVYPFYKNITPFCRQAKFQEIKKGDVPIWTHPLFISLLQITSMLVQDLR